MDTGRLGGRHRVVGQERNSGRVGSIERRPVRIVNVAAATVFMLNAPVASPGHVIQGPPMAPHVQVVPVKPKAAPRLECPGWMVFSPGEELANPIGDTVDVRIYDAAPAGWIIFEKQSGP